MALQVLTPGILHGGLEGEHEHTLHVHAARELVGGEGLAEAHLGVPEELGRVAVAGLLAGTEVRLRLVDGIELLGAHGEVLGALALIAGAVANLQPGVANVGRCAAEPFAAYVLKAVGGKALVDSVIHE